MPWLELHLNVNKDEADQFEEVLTDSGAQAVTYTDAGDQPILEPDVGTTPLWSDVVLVGLYDAAANTSGVEEQIASESTRALSMHWNILEDKVWEREWLQYHRPTKFGNAFWVFHEKVDSELPTLLLDPGLAFGTGTHPTTAMCLEWIANRKWRGETIIDYGCGSGILAVAALLRGASYAHCVDIDTQALDATLNNAQRNSIQETQLSISLPKEGVETKVSVVMANILAGPLVELASCLSALTETGGQICLSGVLKTQEAQVREAYSNCFDDLEVEYLDDWIRISGTRNNQDVRQDS